MSRWQKLERETLLKYFSERFTHVLLGQPVCTQSISFERFIPRQAREVISELWQFEHPINTEHFLDVFDKEWIEQTLIKLDRDAGFEYPLSDLFIRDLSFVDWFQNYIARLLWNEINEHDFSTHSTVTSGTTSSPFDRYTSVTSSQTDPNSLSKSLDGTDHASSENSRIIQVCLKGDTILSAWAAETTIVKSQYNATLKRQEKDYGPPSNWKPGDGTAQYNLYHGTHAHLLKFPDWPDLWDLESPGTLPMGPDTSTGGQLNPRSIRVAYTTFFPLREFLWEYFRGDLYSNFPSIQVTIQMNQS